MKCKITSSKTHDVLISKELHWKSYKEICRGEPKKVNLGYNNDQIHGKVIMEVQNNSIVHSPRYYEVCVHGVLSKMSLDWEVLSKFFSVHNIEPNWLNCNYSWGWFDDELAKL